MNHKVFAKPDDGAGLLPSRLASLLGTPADLNRGAGVTSLRPVVIQSSDSLQHQLAAQNASQTDHARTQQEKGRWFRRRRRAREREVVNKAIVADIHIFHGDVRAADRSRKRGIELRPRRGAGRRSRENQGTEGRRAGGDANLDSARGTR